MGGAGHKAGHNVYIWDRDSGALVKVLEGPKEPLVDCDVSVFFAAGPTMHNAMLGSKYRIGWCWR
jgi:hypothetical protein